MSLFSPSEAALVEEVRVAVANVLPLLAPLEAPTDAERRLRDALGGLDQLFLLVVAGEFNAGKTALINALLGGSYLEEGVTPTTRDVQVVTYGEPDAAVRPDGVRLIAVPAPELAGWSIVDTPGTNAILRAHEALTRDFIPRADLVLFVTSADRPFTESERAFLEAIRAWRKKVVFVINKIDLLSAVEAREEVVSFVSAGAAAELGEAPTVFALSAQRALRAQEAGDAEALVDSGWEPFARWLKANLSAQERLRLKLLSPLGVAERVAEELDGAAAAHLETLRADSAAVTALAEELTAFQAAMHRACENCVQGMDLTIAKMRERGEEFLDERFRLTRIRGLLDRESMERDFTLVVVADAPERLEAEVEHLIDQMIDLEHDQWRRLREGLAARLPEGTAMGEAGTFTARRHALLGTVGREADDVLGSFDVSAASRRLAHEVQEAVTRTAVVEVGAVGLGLVLKTLLVTAAADATGVLFASVIAALGLTIIPRRKRQAVGALRTRTADLSAQLSTGVRAAFAQELAASLAAMHAALDPYEAFVRAEGERLEGALISLAAARHTSHALAERIRAAPVVTEN